MAVKIVLKHSATEDKRPKPGQLENGEIALNYNEAGTFLTCKDTDGNIQQVGGVKISEVAPESPVKQTLWFQPSSLTLFVYDGNSFLPIAGGGGGGTPGGGITTIIGNNGIDASEIAGVVTLDVDLAGGDDGLEFNVGKLKASVASASQLGSVKIGDAITVTGNGTITPRIASASQTGIVKIGDGIDVAGDGTISVDIPQTLVFRGSVDLNNPPTGQISPDPAQGGDTYVASVGANPIDNGWTGIGGESAVAGDLVVFDGTEWELISTGGTMQGVEGGAGITSTTSGGVATVAVDAGTGLSFDGDDKLIVDLDSFDLDGLYLRIDSGTFNQTVASTGETTFSGRTKHANGINLTGSDFKVLGSNSTAKIFPGFNNSSPRSVQVSTVFPKVNSNTLKEFTLYNASFDLSSPNASLDEITAYRAANTLSGSGAGEAYGFHSELENIDGKHNFNFYAGEDAPNFFKGDTFIGGSISTTTRELWESTLTDEQKEQLAAETLVVPANVSTPGDGEFARQWWYDQQDEETQALIDAGELDYPEHFQAANFVDTFDLGVTTNINLLSNGRGEFGGGVKVKGGNDTTIDNGIYTKLSGPGNQQGLFAIADSSISLRAGQTNEGLIKLEPNISGAQWGGDKGASINAKTTVDYSGTLAAGACYGLDTPTFTSPSTTDTYVGYFANYTSNSAPATRPGIVEGFSVSDNFRFLGSENAYGFKADLPADGVKNFNFYAEGNAPNFFQGLTEHGGGVKVTGGSSDGVENGYLFASGYLREVVGSKSITFNDGASYSISLDGSSGVNNNVVFTKDYLLVNVISNDGDGVVFVKGTYNNSTSSEHCSFWAQGIEYTGIANNATINGLKLDSPVNTAGTTAARNCGVNIHNSYTDAFSENIGVYSDISSGARTNFNFYAKGNAPSYFHGEVRGGGVDGANSNWVIRPDGSTSPFNIQLQMQSDEPTAFQTTYSTDEYGSEEQNTTYIGESESLLAIIKDLRARVEALEAAATA